MNQTILQNAGIDYAKGLQRFLGDESLYNDILAIFLSDTTMEEAEAAFLSGDNKALFTSVHALKGASGNTELTDVYATATKLADLLRRDSCPRNEVEALFAQLKAYYARAIDGIRRAMESAD